MVKAKSTSEQKPIAVSSVYGTGISIIICLLLGMLLAFLVNGQTTGEGMIKTAIPVILYVSTTLGGLSAALLAKEKKAIAALITIASSFFILAAINILFMDGSFNGLFPKILGGLIAYATIFLILLRGGRGRKPSSKIRPR